MITCHMENAEPLDMGLEGWHIHSEWSISLTTRLIQARIKHTPPTTVFSGRRDHLVGHAIQRISQHVSCEDMKGYG